MDARALSAPRYQMSVEEARFFSPGGGLAKVTDIIDKLEQNPEIAEHWLQNIPPHPECITDWHKPGTRIPFNHSRLVCSIFLYSRDHVVRSARRSMRWADSQRQIDLRHRQEQSGRLRSEMRSTRDMVHGYHGSYDLPGGD